LTVLDKNGISFEEHLDDLLKDKDIEVIDWLGTSDDLKAVAFKIGDEKYVAFCPYLGEDERVAAKMHEYVHHELDLFYSVRATIREREIVEERIKRKTVEWFLKPEILIKLIRRECTFNPYVLAEASQFSADVIEYAEHYYFDLKGITPPDIEDIYLQ